jgi:HrpA-like RNA helicase
VLAVHSTVPPEEQRMAFKRPPPGVRKVVLATNSAETAITPNETANPFIALRITTLL